MAGQQYNTQVGRLEKFPGRILAKAQKQEQLTKLGAMEQIPQNKSEKIEWLRFYPYGGVDNQWIAAGGDTTFINAHLVSDGVTPSADSLSWTTLNATLQQIGCLYSYTDKTRYVHEEGSEIPREMEDQAAQRIVLCREMQVYGEMKGTTSKYYGGVGTSVGTTNGPPTKALFQKVSRAIQGKHGGFLTKMLKSGANFGSQSVDAGFRVYCHTDMEATFENMAGFTKEADYGSDRDKEPNEIGSIGRFRVCVNPLLTYYPDQGAAVGTWSGSGSGKSTTGVLLDIYPLIVIGEGKYSNGDAFGQVALRGMDSINASHIPVGTKSAADPLGQRGYVGALTWQAQKVLNDGWMGAIFVGTEAL